MKKIIALIAVFATVLSFSACKMNKELTVEEIREQEQIEISKREAESLKAEKDFSEGVEKEVDKLGKTEKGERIVFKEPRPGIDVYYVYEFDKKEIVNARYIYKFFQNADYYNAAVGSGDGTSRELVDKDDKARMVVYELELQEEDYQTFDYLYDLYSSTDYTDYGYEIIE